MLVTLNYDFANYKIQADKSPQGAIIFKGDEILSPTNPRIDHVTWVDFKQITLLE